jgi:diacylglycerol O-acyltransferase / wax synthase
VGRLPLTDAAWLLLESRERPMHVGGLQVFSRPADAPPDWLQQVAVEAMRHAQPREPFNLTLKEPYGRLGTFAFRPDKVEIAYHVRHLALPAPGRIRELLSFVSNVHAQTLDRHRPLWELYLIEGIEHDRMAVYTKVHHSLLDGVAAMRQILKAFTPDPNDRDVPPPWAMRPDTIDPEREAQREAAERLASSGGALRGAASGVKSLVGASRAFIDQWSKSRTSDAEVLPFQAPATMCNVRLTSTRRFVAQDYSLPRIKAVAAATGSTVNDIVLTMCGGALRTYLDSHDALPDKPLIALVPVSIRPADGSDQGNALSFVMCNLATHLADPGDRLELIRSSMNAAKDRMRGMTRAEMTTYAIALTSPLVLGNLTGMSGRGRPLFNVTISNVPGPTDTLYWNGAELQGMYPASLLQDGYALNITQTSYRDQMAFGITADRSALPSVQRLIDHLEDELAGLERLAG